MGEVGIVKVRLGDLVGVFFCGLFRGLAFFGLSFFGLTFFSAGAASTCVDSCLLRPLGVLGAVGVDGEGGAALRERGAAFSTVTSEEGAAAGSWATTERDLERFNVIFAFADPFEGEAGASTAEGAGTGGGTDVDPEI